jgi:Dyp-type peroxidase family
MAPPHMGLVRRASELWGDRTVVELRWDNIQGNITPGFNSPHQAFLLIRFPAGRAARDWLDRLWPEVTSAEDVRRFQAERQRTGARSGEMSATWINVAFTRWGLEALGAESLEMFPEEFREGLHVRAAGLGDARETISEWEVGGTRDTEAHALLILASGRRQDLDVTLERQQAGLARYGVRGNQLRIYRGEQLGGELGGREQFGFADGVSQPVLEVDGTTLPPEQRSQLVAPGEFILGYPDEHGVIETDVPLARDGSYLVFRRLRQDVFGFRRSLGQLAPTVSLRPEQLGAKLVGRWPSGCKLDEPLPRNDPGVAESDATFVTPADFARDPDGERTPRFAHIRKAYPRDLEELEPQRHRLLRRGIPYGPPLAADARWDDGQDRGLLFLAYQASLALQFEHVQRRWFDDVKFPRDGDGPDPLVGAPSGPRVVSLRQQGGRVSSLSLERFVSVTAGGYFFAPSIRALAQLANPTVKLDEESSMPYSDSYRDLGEFIFEQNPYSQQGTLRRGFEAVTESEDYANPAVEKDETKWTTWKFKNENRAIRRAIWVSYDYRDKDGNVKTEHLLIGYAGSGH